MTSGDSARQYHATARSEIIQRLQLRDNVLLVFLGATGALFGIALGTNANPEILLVVPYLTLGATLIISQHHEVIGSLGLFLREELHPALEKMGDAAPEWDTSDALREYHSQAIWMRILAHTILLIIPPLGSLAINWHHRVVSAFPQGLAWWLGALFAGLSVVVLVRSHYQRKRLRSRSCDQLIPPVSASR